MPANSSVFKDFDEGVFDYKLFPYKHNDCYPFNEICLEIGIDQHIDINDWNNNEFFEFINKIKANNKVSAIFSYKLENIEPETWMAKDGKITMNIWDFPGYLYTDAYVDINDNIIMKLEKLHCAIEEFVKTI